MKELDDSRNVTVRILRLEVLGSCSRICDEHIGHGLAQLREVPAQRREGVDRSNADFGSIIAELAHCTGEDVRGVLAPGDSRLHGTRDGLTVQRLRSPPCKPEPDRRCPHDREIAQNLADGDPIDWS